MSYVKKGQNFLIDKNIVNKEINHARITKDDVVLEIGPGKGILTESLAEKARKVIAIEIDKKLIDELECFLPVNVEIIHSDILKVDLDSLPKFSKIVSNIPYQISSPVTFKILDYDFKMGILIYQKEFAERMVAENHSKNYSRLSVGVYYKADCELLELVSKTCFSPKPKVDSYMVKLTPREKPKFKVTDERFFFDVTRELFSHRRKKIKNVVLKKWNLVIEKELFANERVEDLKPEQIGRLSDYIYNLLHI